MMRYSESKDYKVDIVYKRIELITTVIKLRKIVKWTQTREVCCVRIETTII